MKLRQASKEENIFFSLFTPSNYSMEKENPSLKDIYEQIRLVVNTASTKDDMEKIEEKMITKKDLEVLTKELKLEIGKARDEAFVHADRKSEEVIVEVGKIINKRSEHENKFKHELVSAMKRNSLLGAKDLKQLEQAI